MTALAWSETLPRVEIIAERDVFADMIEVRMRIEPPGTPVNYTLDGLDPTILDTRYLAPFKLIRSATVRAWAWGNDEIVERVFVRLPPRDSVSAAGSLPGVTYLYVEGDWTDVTDMKFDSEQQQRKFGAAPAPTLSVRERDEGFGVRFDGLVHAPRRGLYTFYLSADGAVRLEIHGERILEMDALGGETSGYASLDGGFHPFRLDYVRPRGAVRSVDAELALDLEYEGPTTERGPVPFQAWRYFSNQGLEE